LEVHSEIRDLGAQIQRQLAQRQPTTADAILANMRQFGPSAQSKAMLQKELEGAMMAQETGCYIVFRNPRPTGGGLSRRITASAAAQPKPMVECCRIGPRHKCFCTHTLAEHQPPNPRAHQPPGCAVPGCPCRCYRYVPNTPDEIGEGYLSKRRGFDPAAWGAKCRCGHTSQGHHPESLKCRSCSCFRYEGQFACLVCDGTYEEHETVLESEAERVRDRRAVGEAFQPLRDVDPEFREIVFGGSDPESQRRAAERQQLRTQIESAEFGVTALILEAPDATAGGRGGPMAVGGTGLRPTRLLSGRPGSSSGAAPPALGARPASVGAGRRLSSGMAMAPPGPVSSAPPPAAAVACCALCGVPYRTERSKFCSSCGAARSV
jgi:hypothetical protein